MYTYTSTDMKEKIKKRRKRMEEGGATELNR